MVIAGRLKYIGCRVAGWSKSPALSRLEPRSARKLARLSLDTGGGIMALSLSVTFSREAIAGLSWPQNMVLSVIFEHKASIVVMCSPLSWCH